MEQETTPALQPGTITRIEQQKRDAERVSVFLDGAFAFGLTLDLAVQRGLRKGQHLSVEEQEDLLAEEERLRARRAALDYIAHQPRTEGEVRRRLRQRGYPEAATEEAVARMRELGYLDDAAYARAYARSRLAGRGHGPQRILSDLLRRGVERATIEAVLEELVEEDDLREAALEHGRKRWARLAGEPDPQKRRRRLAGFLARRGYGYDLIREVTETLEDEG